MIEDETSVLPIEEDTEEDALAAAEEAETDEETDATESTELPTPGNEELVGKLVVAHIEPTEERIGFLSITGPLVDIQLEKNFIKILEYRGMLANRDALNKIFAEYTDGQLQLSESCSLIVNGADVVEWKNELSW